MSDIESLLANLKRKGWVDDESVEHLKKRLRKKLKEEEQTQKEEITQIREEVISLKLKLIS